MGVSKNSGTPKPSILIGFSIINHPFWGTPIFGNTHMVSTHYLQGFHTCWVVQIFFPSTVCMLQRLPANFLDATGSCFRWCLASVFFGISRCMWNEAFLLQGPIHLAVEILGGWKKCDMYDSFGMIDAEYFCSISQLWVSVMWVQEQYVGYV